MNSIATSLDPNQLAFRTNTYRVDVTSTSLDLVFTHREDNTTYLRMLFVDFSTAFNMMSSMKLIVKLSTMFVSTTLFNWIYDFLTDPRQFGLVVIQPSLWHYDQSFPGLCTQPSPSHAVQPWLQSPTWRELLCEVCGWHFHHWLDFLEQWEFTLGNQQFCKMVQRQQSTSAKPRSWYLILEKKKEWHISVTIMKYRWSRWTVLGSWESTSYRTCHIHQTAQKWLHLSRKLKKAKFPCLLLNFYKRVIKTILPGNITNWHGKCIVLDRKALQQVIKTTQNITATQILSISEIAEVRCLVQIPKILQNSTQPSHCPFHPPDVWQEIQEYP